MSFPVVSSRFTHTDKQKSSLMSFPVVSGRFRYYETPPFRVYLEAVKTIMLFCADYDKKTLNFIELIYLG